MGTVNHNVIKNKYTTTTAAAIVRTFAYTQHSTARNAPMNKTIYFIESE